tara:strand:+ start:3381 stop:4547 length:1167 start_codon:yes stop_codon:yes gene_type:complete
MAIQKLKTFDVYVILMSLEGIYFSTSLGGLSLSLIGSFLFLTRIKFRSIAINIKSVYGNSLFLLGLFLTFTSFFIGSSIIGNLSRLWISIFIAYFLPYLDISSQKWANAIKKTILFHALFLIFDFIFETPWGWDAKGYFFLGLGSPDFHRAQGLFGEPSFYALTVNCLLLILIILRKCSIYDCLLVLSTNLLSTSASGFLCSLVIFLTNYSFETILFLKKLFFKRLFDKKILFILPFIFIFLAPFIIFNSDFIIKRLSDPLSDSSMLSRTIGTFSVLQYVFENSPIIGFGFGSEQLQNIDFNNINLGSEINENLQKIVPTTANSFVGIFFKGGFIGLFLYLLYILKALKLRFLIAYFLILASSGKTFFIFSFLVPAFNHYIKEREKKA